jgi:hypothetical protein
MTVSANYSRPVAVDGYLCWNCKQVAEAKKGENPNPPPSATGAASSSGGASGASPAVVFGGQLSGLTQAPAASATPSPGSSGQTLNILA